MFFPFALTEDHFRMAAAGEGQRGDENWGCNRLRGLARPRKRKPASPCDAKDSRVFSQ